MNVRRALAVARKSLSQFRHDKRTLGFVIGMPLLMVVVFGYTFGGQVTHVRTWVVNQDSGTRADDILGHITGDTLELLYTQDFAAAVQDVRAGRAWAVLLFNETFSADLVSRNATLTIVLDGTQPLIRGAVLGEVRTAVEETFASGGGVQLPITFDRQYVYGSEEVRSIDSFAPGIIGLAVLMVTTILSVIIIVREKAGGMLERLFSTPLKASEFVLGQALALAVIALAQSTVVLVAALLLFQVQVVGNLALAFLFLLLFAVGNQGLGILLSASARNELQAIQFVPLILFPSLLLTGVFFPLEAIPTAFRPFSYIVPLTYANDALRSVMLRGWGLGELWVDLAVLLVYDFLTLAAAALFVRRQA